MEAGGGDAGRADPDQAEADAAGRIHHDHGVRAVLDDTVVAAKGADQQPVHANLKVGDDVRFRFHRDGKAYIISSIERAGAAQ